MATPSLELIGRQEEIAQLDAFVARLRQDGCAVLVRGEPGIGKTVLWRHAVAAAEREGTRVLVARCAEAEMPVPLGAVADLLDPTFEDVAGALTDPQRGTLAAALGIEGGPTRPDRLALLRAVVAAFRALAVDAPLLVAIDDVQWLDPASTRVLAFAVRRMGDVPVGVLATLRGGPQDHEPLGLVEACEPGAFSEIALGPLEMEAVQQLVYKRVHVRIPPSRLATVHAASGGNPMFALEFVQAIGREETDLRAQPPVPSSLQDLVLDRIRRLPADILPLLELVSAVERPTPSLIARAFGDSAETLVDAAVSAGAISVGSDEIIRFTHPLLAAAVYDEMPPGRRRTVHGEAARIVEDLEQQARHLALSTPEPNAEIADVVERAAVAAVERGAPDAAATFAAEAVRLTPPDDEQARIRRVFVGAGYSMEAGDVPAARTRIEPLLDPTLPAAIRSQALVFRAETEHQDRPMLRAYLREAIEITPDPRVRCQALLRYAQQGGWISRDSKTAAESAREARRIAAAAGDRPLTAVATAALAYYEAARGERGIEFDEAELATVEQLPRMAPWQITPAMSVGSRLLWAGELDRARAILRHEYDELVEQGSLLRLPLVLMAALADVEWRAGRWQEAEVYAEEAQAFLDDALPGGAHVVAYARVLVAGSLGRVDEARRLGENGLRVAEQYDDLNILRIRWALGHVELAHGDAVAAWQSLGGLPEALEEFGIAEPAWQPILPDVVETLVALGRLDEAEAVLSGLEQQAAALDHRWATPAALRCRALLLLAGERSDDAAVMAERAAADLEQLGFPLDQARALFVAGSARRRAGQRRLAAELLRNAIEILAALPAPVWQQRVEDELRRAAPRPRRDRELTNAERRVAALVVEGRTNREVAAELFTTVATVEAHLTRIYRKTGVRSRTELARAVAAGAVVLDEQVETEVG